MKNFPWKVYSDHKNVACCMCYKVNPDVKPERDNYYAVDNGGYRKKCACGLYTWFNLADDE